MWSTELPCHRRRGLRQRLGVSGGGAAGGAAAARARARLTRARAHARREGEDARCFLVECAERFLRRHALEGYEPHLHAALGAVRGDAEAGRPDVPAADIVAAEIKRVRGLKEESAAAKRLPCAGA